jgi:AhpD family alkylhydroperoxidase
MDARLDVMSNPAAPKVIKHLRAVNDSVTDLGLPLATQELIKVRASQINGCGMCLDMHTKDALAAGEDPVRLNLVAAWREATVFTEAERAAIELAEQGTRIADGGQVTEEAWANAAVHYDEDQLMAIVTLVALINTFNRLNVMTRQPAGYYEPGMFG